jgi:hypothetical protein
LSLPRKLAWVFPKKMFSPADLRPHLGDVKIAVLGTWPHRGNVELYFKHRYKQHQVQIGMLTEYYQFAEAKRVLRDLRRMKAKELTELERGTLLGLPSPREEKVRLEAIEQKRRAMIRLGMKKAAAHGRRLGRPPGSGRIQDIDTFLAKPKSQAVRQALEQGQSLREAARSANVSVNTVRKVQRAQQLLNERK